MLARKIAWWIGLAIAWGVSLLALPLLGGFLGAVHPAFDSISHFRLHLAGLIAVAALALALIPGWRLGAVAVLALAAIPTLATTGLPFLPDASARAETPRYSLLHLNLRYDNPEPQSVLSLIGRERPDIVSLAEVSEMWEPWIARLAPAYPHVLRCRADTRNGGVALLSRRPFAGGDAGSCHDRNSLAIVSVDFAGRSVDVASVYLGWPWPFGQDWQVGEVLPHLARMGDTAILAGDFNAAPWSLTLRRIEEGTQTALPAWAGPTWLDRRLPEWLRPWVGLPIDHVLTKGGIRDATVSRLEWVGSDHLPVLMRFSLAPPPAEPAVQQAASGSATLH